MERKEIAGRLGTVFKKLFSNESFEFSNDLTANDVEQWNSLSHMLLITEVENAFSIKFKLKELNKMHNVGDMIDLIISKM